MQFIYDIISADPEYFFWVFSLVNIAWLLFTYFHKQQFQKKIIELKHSLLLDSDKRKKIFELKATQYELYVTKLDRFGKKNQVDMPAKIRPIMEEYWEGYLSASLDKNDEKMTEIVTWYIGEISKIMEEVSVDILELQAESNKLKLTATDEMLVTFDELEVLISNSMELSQKFISNFADAIQNPKKVLAFQENINILSTEIQKKSHLLMQQMRNELKNI